MRRHIIIFSSFVAALLSMSACNFLNVEQIGKSDIEGYYSEPSAARAAVYGTHNILYGLVDKYVILYPEIAADCVVLESNEATWDLYQNFAVTSDDEIGAMGYIWKNAYQTINNANQIIEHVPGLKEEFPRDAADLDSYMAQALFLRAYAHLCLCLTFGQNYSYTVNASHLGCAVVTKPLSLSECPSRNTVAQVYDQIVKDLQTAIKYFPEDYQFNKFLPSPEACEALLARVYLYMGKWSEARSCADNVISKISLTQRDNYVTMFNAMKAPEKDEMIYSLNGIQQNSTVHKIYWKNEPKARPSVKVLNLFEEDDIRLEVLSSSGDDVVLKFEQEDGQADPYANIPILRVSEMYLVRAEAALMLGDINGAVADVKALQERARGHEVSFDEVTTAEDADRLIEEERIRELCFEGHRLWDISRRHKNIVREADHTSTVKELSYPDYRFVLPIPSVELEANGNMVNNPTSNE